MFQWTVDPILCQLGPLVIRWYGFLHVAGFALAFVYCEKYRSHAFVVRPFTRDELFDVFFYAAVGVIVGGAWGYLFLYEMPAIWIEDPMRFFRFWAPGRSFHGGLVGVIIGVWIFSQRTKRSFWSITDYIAPAVPLGILMGRLGNFMNGELWGRITQKPWGMIFAQADQFPRHPSPLYESVLEGLLLFIVLHIYSRQPRFPGAVSALFLIGYGLCRIIAEYFREPDRHLGFGSDYLTWGQWLCIPMIAFGIGVFIVSFLQKSVDKVSCNNI